MPIKETTVVNGLRFCNILRIRFLTEGYPSVKNLLDNGALMVVPSAPVLSTISKDAEHHLALMKSDFAIPDSGLLILLLKYFKRIKIGKLSGLTFLRHFLEEEILRKERCLFLVDPEEKEMMLNHTLLKSMGILISLSDHYVAPIYSSKNIEDPELLETLEKRKPKYVLINLGGGIQEKLGFYLKSNLSFKTGIICTGAAIAFLTGKQASIPSIFDAFHLGWLLRCIHDPRRFVPRYLKGLALIPLILKEVR